MRQWGYFYCFIVIFTITFLLIIVYPILYLINKYNFILFYFLLNYRLIFGHVLFLWLNVKNMPEWIIFIGVVVIMSAFMDCWHCFIRYSASLKCLIFYIHKIFSFNRFLPVSHPSFKVSLPELTLLPRYAFLQFCIHWFYINVSKQQMGTAAPNICLDVCFLYSLYS